MIRKLLGACILGSFFVHGCSAPPLCRIGPTFAPPGASVDSLELLAFERLLLARREGETERDRMCTGAPSRYPEPPSDCVEHEDLGAPLPDAPLSLDALVLEATEGGLWLAYLPIRAYASGLTEGPVGIVERHGDDVEVRALGMLRTLPERVSLRLERVGDDVLLFADGERCIAGETACQRATRVLLLRERRFLPLYVSTAQRSCLSPAIFARQETRTIAASARTERIFTRLQGLDVEDRVIRISEEITVAERDRDAGTAPRVVRRSDATVTLVVRADEARLLADGTSRWSTLLLDASSLDGSD